MNGTTIADWTIEKISKLSSAAVFGYTLKVDGLGRVWYDSECNGDGTAGVGRWLNVTGLFIAHEGDASDLVDRIDDFGLEHHCSECCNNFDPMDLVQFQWADYEQQVCCDCGDMLMEQGMDPYQLYGMRRSDFY